MFASYSGGSWKEIISDGVDTGGIQKLYTGSKSVYLLGEFATLNGVAIPGDIAEYASGTFRPLDVDVESSTATRVDAALETPDGSLWIGGSWTTTPVTAAGIVTPSNGSSKAYPVIRFIGPGVLWGIRNYTTGKELWFNSLTLQAGETAILDLRPGMVKFMSDWRGNILKYLPGSDFDFFLIPGSNNISLYMTGTSAATKAYMSYKNRYWSIDAAAR
jgi:hypothetical protein